MSTTRTATRLTVAASLLVALVFALLPWGSAAAEEAPRVTVSDLTLQRVDRTGAAGGALLTAGALIGAGIFIRSRRKN